MALVQAQHPPAFYAVVAELVKATVLKTVCGNTLVGSNPIYCAKL